MGFMKIIEDLQFILISSHEPFPYRIGHGSIPYSASNPARKYRVRILFFGLFTGPVTGVIRAAPGLGQ
jgi:hypothetical protein